ncbi:MAG: hypothetical protein ACRDD1_04365, partial [Planctomycetia bacterium]
MTTLVLLMSTAATCPRWMPNHNYCPPAPCATYYSAPPMWVQCQPYVAPIVVCPKQAVLKSTADIVEPTVTEAASATENVAATDEEMVLENAAGTDEEQDLQFASWFSPTGTPQSLIGLGWGPASIGPGILTPTVQPLPGGGGFFGGGGGGGSNGGGTTVGVTPGPNRPILTPGPTVPTR